MKPSDKREFSQLITDALAYYRADCSAFVLGLWWQACQQYDMEQVSKALTSHAMDPERGVYAPKVADIVRVLSGTHTDRALLAWGRVYQALSQVGAYRDVCFDDAAINVTIQDMGGWPKLCRCDMKDLGYIQHRFCEAYKAYAGRGVFDYPRFLGGDRGISTIERKYPDGWTPCLIGNRDAALRVFQGGAHSGGELSLMNQIRSALPWAGGAKP